MQIDLTSDEYKTLVKLLFIGNFVINGNRNSPDEWDKEVENLLEKIFAKYKEFNASKLIVFIKEMSKHYVTSPYELEFLDLIDEFTDEYYNIQQEVKNNCSRLKD